MTLILPYIDVSVNYNSKEGRPNEIYSKQIVEYGADGAILGFLVLSPNKSPFWAGQENYELEWALLLAREIKAAGKKLGVSIGGAGTDLSNSLSVEELINAYSNIIDVYEVDLLDFNLHGSGFYKIDSICSALKTINARYPRILISITIKVNLKEGSINPKCIESITKIKNIGIDFILNGNIHNFSSNKWGSTKNGDAGVAAIHVLKNTLKPLYPSLTNEQIFEKLSISPQIGLNKDRSVFSITDTRNVSSFAKQNNMAFVSFMILNRDNPSKTPNEGSTNPKQKKSGEYTSEMVNARNTV